MYNGERLATGDACFFYSENEFGVYQGAAILIYDGPLDYERVVNDIDAKLDRLPRLRQHAVPVPFHIAHPTWEFDPEFDIRDHIVPIELDAPGTDEQLLALATRLSEEFIPRDKALWKIYVINGLQNGRSATVNVVHHALADGGGMKAFHEVLNDYEPNPTLGSPGEREYPPTPSAANRFVRGVRDDCVNVLKMLTGLPRFLVELPRTLFSKRFWSGWRIMMRYLTTPTIKMPYNAHLGGRKAYAWTMMPMAELQKIRRALHGTVNDLFLSLVTGAIERYAHKHGIRTEGKHCLVQSPVDVRPPGFEEELGNHVATMSVAIPFGITDPAKRMRVVNERTTEAKEANLGYGMHVFLETWRKAFTPPIARLVRLAYHAPISQRWIHRLKHRPSLHVCASNVAGPPEAIYLAGRKCIMQVPMGLAVHGCGLFCTAFSYDGRFHFGVATDADAAPDVDDILKFLIEEYEELRRATGVVREGAAPAISPMGVQDYGPQTRAHTNGTSKQPVDVAAAAPKAEGPNQHA